jgi:hypothetical protein
MDPEVAKAINYAQKLHEASLDVVPEHVELNQDDWTWDLKFVGLTILCRSISNFRAVAEGLSEFGLAGESAHGLRGPRGQDFGNRL